MKACNIDTESWEVAAENGTLWKQQVLHGLKLGAAAEDKTARKKASASKQRSYGITGCMYQGCNGLCKSRIGLYSHTG